MSRSNHDSEQESEQFMRQIQDLKEEEECLHKRNKRKLNISIYCIVFFAFFMGLSIYCIVIDWNKEPLIPASMACSVFMALSIYYAIVFGRKHYYWQRDAEIARRDRARARVLFKPENEQFEEESDSRSSPADFTDPAAEGPTNLPQTESSTLSERTSTQESSEKASLSDSTKGTFTTTAIIEQVAVAETYADVLSGVEEKISKNEDEYSKPSTSSQPDSTDCSTVDVDSKGEIGNVRHRRPTP